ncbi:hypothetical protein EI42_01454 [Thermosporothrix hazakensis]|uniref:Uncharacterized protein n=1 Tax=Thermosporothrix hazakensis TaxID=644383 RepID=A0A326UBE8_THEHA|nr:hypothetical protein [Thermosporothrix hazakensis]PZW32909.1 hypothetical protein EI42_01454 [Thermosporothrix hazakensis]
MLSKKEYPRDFQAISGKRKVHFPLSLFAPRRLSPAVFMLICLFCLSTVLSVPLLLIAQQREQAQFSPVQATEVACTRLQIHQEEGTLVALQAAVLKLQTGSGRVLDIAYNEDTRFLERAPLRASGLREGVPVEVVVSRKDTVSTASDDIYTAQTVFVLNTRLDPVPIRLQQLCPFARTQEQELRGTVSKRTRDMLLVRALDQSGVPSEFKVALTNKTGLFALNEGSVVSLREGNILSLLVMADVQHEMMALSVLQEK